MTGVQTCALPISDAVTKMIRISAKIPYWGHATSIIIGEEVAREGIMTFLDLISRNAEVRLGIDVFISKGQSAKEVLSHGALSTDVKSYELAIMVNESKYLVKVPVLKAYEVINELQYQRFTLYCQLYNHFLMIKKLLIYYQGEQFLVRESL